MVITLQQTEVHTVVFTVDDGVRRRRRRRRGATCPVVAADKPSVVGQDVERITGGQLTTARDARETVDMVDDVGSGCATYQVRRRNDATAASTLDAVPSVQPTHPTNEPQS